MNAHSFLGSPVILLNYILTGTRASPLHRALIDSGLGEAYTGWLNSQLRQPSYTVGLKGIDLGNADEVEALILATLGGLADKGIERPTVEAAMNITEFLLREYNTGSFPRGIAMMFTALQASSDDKARRGHAVEPFGQVRRDVAGAVAPSEGVW
jgi:Zn-dependent M16 (insulinase) family peptidase